jgi:hypothetical protein
LFYQKPINTIGYYDGRVIADVENYKQLQHLSGIDKNYIWRSNREDEYIFYVKQRMNEGGNGLDNG